MCATEARALFASRDARLEMCAPQADRLATAQQTLESNISRLYETAKGHIEERGKRLSALRLEIGAARVERQVSGAEVGYLPRQ